MTLFELFNEQDTPLKTVDSDVNQEPKDSQIQSQEPARNHANSAQLKAVKDYLAQQFPAGKFGIEKAAGVKQVAHVRARGISLAMLKTAMQGDQYQEEPADTKQISTSSTFPAYSFSKNGISYTVVIGMKGVKQGSEDSVGIARKELTPAGLGIQGGIFSKEQLITATSQAIESKIRSRDETLANALIELLNNAASGGKTPVAKDLMDHINPYLGVVSQDFGEILAPVLILQPNQKAELPTGNNPLVDVKIPGMNLSIKALTGSGTSFRSIADLMDKFETSLQDDDTKEKYRILKQFHPKAGGKNVDKIIAASTVAKTPEYEAAVKKFGQFKNYSELVEQMKKWPWTEGGRDQYKDFLMAATAVFQASGGSNYVGMPADGKFYLGLTDKAPVREKAAGFPSFKANPFKSAADVLTYSLGVGLLNMIKTGKDSAKYSKMMTDIVNKADAVIGHITINPNGTMQLKTKPFRELNFEFQYHAPSHIPGNNLPGFIAVFN